MSDTNEMKENAPITITLGNICKLLEERDELATQTLLDFLTDDLYLNIGSQSRTKIRNCVQTTQKKTYNQAYTAYRRITDTYFKPEGKQYQQIASLRKHIFNVWKERFQSPCTQFPEISAQFLLDDTLHSSQTNKIKEFRKFLEKFQSAEDPSDKAEFMTVLTLLSITRGTWEQLSEDSVKMILPDNYKDCTLIIEKSEEEKQFEDAETAYKEGQYEKCLDLLTNLERPLRTETNHSEDRELLYKFNSKVLYLRSQVRKNLRNTYEKTSREYTDLTEDIRYDLDEASENKCTDAMIEIARDYFTEHTIYPADDCEEKCRQICKKLLETDIESRWCGEACWMLYHLENDNTAAEQYLKKAADYSYPEAVKIYKENHAVSLPHVLDNSADDSSGVYYINEKNDYSKIIKKTAAEKWRREKNIEKCMEQDHQRYFLISNDFDKNLSELLQLLQKIKPLPDEKNNNKDKFEFFIRGDEEKISPFVDTALARIENKIIPVRILDDNKMAARILAQHPLFYPIRKLKKNEPAQLNLVVIGNTPCCEWLIREAYWMLTFRNPNIKTAIHVFAPDAETFVEKIFFRCPDMDRTNIVSVPCDYESSTLLSKIEGIIANEYTYFAIDTSSDINNMSLAVKIRETTIRKEMEKSANEFKPEFPIIAFRCQNPDIANLSHRTIVINEDFGSQWFNNYSIIPFGRIDRHYHWDALTNNIFDQLSMNIHLQYYPLENFNSNTDPEEYEQQYKAARKDFFGRTYNRDSSIAAAMSLPYRLYQGFIDRNRILPTGRLNILDADAFYSDNARKSYIEQVQAAKWSNADYTKTIKLKRQTDYNDWFETIEEYDPESELYQLAEWEHNRWNRFMISRGWRPSKNEQVKLYYEKGNQRQQLYIGKMHPCINEFAKLEKLEKEWLELSGNEKPFRMNDISSIQKTEKILGLDWIREAEKYFDSKDKDKNER